MQNSDLANVRVAKQNKFAKEEYMTSEQLMYSIAEQDGDLMTSILEEIANEEKIKQTEKEISVLRGDLKPVSNPFGKKKGNV
jgi:methionyl-tRNA formyltransferase